MNILISILLSESTFNFGKWSNCKIRKYAYLRIFGLTTSRRPKLIPKADLKWECPLFWSIFQKVKKWIFHCIFIRHLTGVGYIFWLYFFSWKSQTSQNIPLTRFQSRGHFLSFFNQNFSSKQFLNLKNLSTSKIHSYTTKITKGTEQFLNLINMGPKLATSPNLNFYLQYFSFFLWRALVCAH